MSRGQPTKSSTQADTQIRDDYTRQKSTSPVLDPQFCSWATFLKYVGWFGAGSSRGQRESAEGPSPRTGPGGFLYPLPPGFLCFPAEREFLRHASGRRQDQSRQKSLNRVGDSSVYLTVCWIDRCPGQSWIAFLYRAQHWPARSHSRGATCGCQLGKAMLARSPIRFMRRLTASALGHEDQGRVRKLPARSSRSVRISSPRNGCTDGLPFLARRTCNAADRPNST